MVAVRRARAATVQPPVPSMATRGRKGWVARVLRDKLATVHKARAGRRVRAAIARKAMPGPRATAARRVDGHRAVAATGQAIAEQGG